MDLRDVRERLMAPLAEHAGALAANWPIRDCAAALECLSEVFQAFAICALLTQYDVDKFRENLVRSAHARRYFLRKAAEANVSDDRRLALSRGEAVLDALAAADIVVAREIAERSIRDWHANWEYEDDFCYYLFIHDCILHDGTPAEAITAPLLERYEQSLEGGDDPRLKVCQSLVERDPEKFIATFSALMNAKQEQIDQQRPNVVDSKFLFWPRSFVSVEGLALLRLAEMAGLAIAEEFPLCPAESRLALHENSYADIFQDLERTFNGNA